MKRRDYYILAILACLIVYAAFHRRSFGGHNADKINNLMKQNTSSEVLMQKDSTGSSALQVDKAEI